MLDALLFLVANWISLWDVHAAKTIAIGTIVGGFVLSVNQYLVCALISPEFKSADDFNLRAFHDRQGRAYVGAFVSLIVISLVINFAAGYGLGYQKWTSENAVVLAMLPAAAIPLFVQRQIVQIAGAIALAILAVIYTLLYYPVLS
jgi:hypothetical protein